MTTWQNCLCQGLRVLRNSKFKLRSASSKKEEDKRKCFSTAWTLFLPNVSCISEQSRDIQEVLSLILHCKTMYCYRTTSPSTSTTPGNANELHSIIESGLVPGGRSLKKDKQSVFFIAANPMDNNQDLEEVQYDLDKPGIAVYFFFFLESSPTYSFSLQFETRSEKKDCSSIKHDHMQSLFSTHYLRYVSRKWYTWRLERIYCCGIFVRMK